MIFYSMTEVGIIPQSVKKKKYKKGMGSAVAIRQGVVFSGFLFC